MSQPNPPFILLHEAISDSTRRAVIAANPTQNHHFIAQAEQRQFAFNTEVNPQNQNVYRWPLHRIHRKLQQADSVNIDRNLGSRNLYTLSHIDNSAKQYNLEGWFNRYESGLEQHIEHLRRLPASDAVHQQALQAVLKLKLLSLMRNPFNQRHWLRRHLHAVYRQQARSQEADFLALIRQRADVEDNQRKRQFGWQEGEYAAWLASLYSMMCDSDCAPSWFEQMCATLLANPDAISLYLHHYSQGQCLFADSGFALQADRRHIRIGFGLASDMFVLLQIREDWWQALPQAALACYPAPVLPVTVADDQHAQRLAYNRLCLAQAHEAVHGKSRVAADYLF